MGNLYGAHDGVPTDEEEADSSELGEALQIFVELTRRRQYPCNREQRRLSCRQRAEKFYHTLRRFLAEYESAVLELEGLSAAEPLLKGTHLSQKIQDLKDTVKRKYGEKVRATLKMRMACERAAKGVREQTPPNQPPGPGRGNIQRVVQNAYGESVWTHPSDS
eukprot:2293465-Rhodomonas_salina.2